MRNIQGSVLNSLLAARGFLDAHADQLGTVVNTGARKALDTAIANLQSHVTNQGGSQLTSKSTTSEVLALRQALVRDHLRPITAIAKAALPGVTAASGLILPGGRFSSANLVQVATGMAQAAQPYSDVFVAAGLPADFIAQLTTAASALQAAITTRANGMGAQRGATKGIQDQASAGRAIVKVLDTLVQTALQGNPSLLAEWNSVKRVRRPASARSTAPTPLAGLTTTQSSTTTPVVPGTTPTPATPVTPPVQSPAPAQPSSTTQSPTTGG